MTSKSSLESLPRSTMNYLEVIRTTSHLTLIQKGLRMILESSDHLVTIWESMNVNSNAFRQQTQRGNPMSISFGESASVTQIFQSWYSATPIQESQCQLAHMTETQAVAICKYEVHIRMHERSPSFTLNSFFCEFFFCYVSEVLPKTSPEVCHVEKG